MLKPVFGSPMIIQCDHCQSQFRIADEKVPPQGARVNCPSCKNKFIVRRPAQENSIPAPDDVPSPGYMPGDVAAREAGWLPGPEAAAPHYRDTIALDPTHAEAHYNLANALIRLGDARNAETHYRRASESRSGFAKAEFGIGVALERLGESESALAAYRTAIATDPRFAPAHLKAARLLHADGAYGEAELHMAAALQLRPRHALTWRSASALRADQGRTDEAIELLRYSISLDPDYAPAQEQLDELLARQEQAGAAPADSAQ
jgi:predicted Zn finger-like uncharacterized protein